MPDHGHTVSRTLLDTMLLEHARSTRAVVRQGRRVNEPVLDSRGRVTRVTLKAVKGLRRRGDRRRRRLLTHQTRAEVGLGTTATRRSPSAPRWTPMCPIPTASTSI